MYKDKIITIPNILSFIRLLLVIPLLITFFNEEYLVALIILIVSGITDIIDGIIARTFHMISDVGKWLDAVADKITQIAIFGCIASLHEVAFILFILLIILESFKGILHIITHKKTNVVYGSEWHGKITTVVLYIVAGLHLLFPNMNSGISALLVTICITMLIFSFTGYTIKCLKILKAAEAKEAAEASKIEETTK